MALQKNIVFTNGLVCDNAYIKILSVGGGKENAVIELAVFKDKSYSDNNNFIEKEYFNFVPSVAENAPNFIKQAYEYLKSLPEFVGVVDI